MKSSVVKLLRTIFVWFGLFVIGVGIILCTQYFSQKDILENAKQVYEDYTSGQPVETSQMVHTSIFLQKNDTLEPICIYSAPENPDAHALEASALLAHHKDFDDYYGIRLHLNPLSLYAIGLASGHQESGDSIHVVAIRSVGYILSILLMFITVYTMAFIFVLIYIRLLHKTNRRVAEIYERYIANVSHELKSPIASIKVMNEALSEGYIQGETELSRSYGIIDREATRLEHSIQDIIQLSKVQDHRLDFRKHPVNIALLIDDVYAQFSPICEGREICLKVSLPERSLYGQTNHDRLLQVLIILLDNAVKYVDDGGTIQICADWLKVRRKKYVEIRGFVHVSG